MSQAAPPLLTQFSRTMNRFHWRPDPFPQRFTDRHHIGFLTSTDIYRAGIVGIEGGDIGSHDIADENIVSGLFTVTVDHRTFAGK